MNHSFKRISNSVCHGFHFLAVKIQRKLNSLSIGVINRGISNQMGSFPGEVTLARGKEIAIQCTVVVVGFAEQKLFLLLRQKSMVMGIPHIVNVIQNFAVCMF